MKNEEWLAKRFDEFQYCMLENITTKGFTPDEIATFSLVLGVCGRLGLDEGKLENVNLCLKRGVEIYNANASQNLHPERTEED